MQSQKNGRQFANGKDSATRTSSRELVHDMEYPLIDIRGLAHAILFTASGEDRGHAIRACVMATLDRLEDLDRIYTGLLRELHPDAPDERRKVAKVA